MGDTRSNCDYAGRKLGITAMSVINQVLHNLEKRGAATPSTLASVRVVPPHNNNRVLWLLGALGVLILVWAGFRQSTIPQPAIPPKPQQLPTPTTAAPPIKLSVAAINPDTPPAHDKKTVLPAMRLSYELSASPQITQFKFKPQLKPNLEPESNQVEAGTTESKPVSMPKEQTDVVEKQLKQFSPQQRAENEFRRATELVQKGRVGEALDAYAATLKLDEANEDARQAMIWLLLENKRNGDAEQVLQDGLKINKGNTEFAMLLARLQVERGNLPSAMETLQQTLPDAGQQAEYHAFVAALYQRTNQHNEAITHYQIAIQQMPNTGIWLMGLGVSLHEMQRDEEARAAFKSALATKTLSAELQAFVEQRLKELS